MFYFSKTQFSVEADKDDLRKRFVSSLCCEHKIESVFGKSVSYTGLWNYDEWLLTRNATISSRISISPDVHIRVLEENQRKSSIQVLFDFSLIWKIMWVFLMLLLISTCLFVPKIQLFGIYISTNWLTRLLIFILSSLFINGMIWLSFYIQVQRLKKYLAALIYQSNM